MDWLEAVPEEFRSDPTISGYKLGEGENLIPVPPSLIKGYFNANKMVGADKIPLPKPDAPADQWNDFFGRIGRPQSADAYKFPKVEGVPPEIDSYIKDKGIEKAFRDHAHYMGLTDAQAGAIYKWFMESQLQEYQANQTAWQASRQDLETGLRKKWGAGYEAMLSKTHQLVQKYGSQGLVEFLDATGGSNHPALAEFLGNIVQQFSEDTLKGEGPRYFGPMTAEQAKAELDKLATDQDFQKALYDKDSPGHAAAVQRRQQLYSLAFPDPRDVSKGLDVQA